MFLFFFGILFCFGGRLQSGWADMKGQGGGWDHGIWMHDVKPKKNQLKKKLKGRQLKGKQVSKFDIVGERYFKE